MSAPPPSLPGRTAALDSLALLAVAVGVGLLYLRELAAWPGLSLNLCRGGDMQAFIERGGTDDVGH